MGKWLLFLFGLPQALLIAWPGVAICWALRRVSRPRFERYGVLVATKRNPDKRFSQTILGPGILLTQHADDGIAGLDSRTESHERRHVVQLQVLAFGCLLLATSLLALSAIDLLAAFLIWLLGPVLIFAGSYLCGWLECGQVYYGSEFERSAYAQTGLSGEPSSFWAEYRKRWND